MTSAVFCLIRDRIIRLFRILREIYRIERLEVETFLVQTVYHVAIRAQEPLKGALLKIKISREWLQVLG